jgi:hypothetical protein
MHIFSFRQKGEHPACGSGFKIVTGRKKYLDKVGNIFRCLYYKGGCFAVVGTKLTYCKWAACNSLRRFIQYSGTKLSDNMITM